MRADRAEPHRLLFELVKDTLGVDANAPEPAVPPEAELRDQARELAYPSRHHDRERPNGPPATCSTF